MNPSRTFERIDQHPFVFKVNEAKRLACIDETTWKSWCKEVQQGFVQRNLPALPIELIPRNNGNFLDNLRFDPRCFVDHFNALTSAYYSLHSQHLIQAREMKDLRHDFAAMSRRNERMEKQLIESNKHIERIGNRIEVMTPTKKKLDDEPIEGVIPFYSVTISRWRKDLGARDYFSNFFYDQCIEGYEREKASSVWSRLLPSEKVRIKNHHKKMKKFIKIMLFFCTQYPNSRPESVDELVKWKQDVARIAYVAETTLYECLGADPKRKKFSFDYILSHPLVKRFDNKDDLYARPYLPTHHRQFVCISV